MNESAMRSKFAEPALQSLTCGEVSLGADMPIMHMLSASHYDCLEALCWSAKCLWKHGPLLSATWQIWTRLRASIQASKALGIAHSCSAYRSPRLLQHSRLERLDSALALRLHWLQSTSMPLHFAPQRGIKRYGLHHVAQPHWLNASAGRECMRLLMAIA